MTFSGAIVICLAKFRNFEGRASRFAFWWFALAFSLFFVAIGSVVPILVGPAQFIGAMMLTLARIFLLFALSAAGFRRLHDFGWPGWPFLVPLAMTLLWYVSLVVLMLLFGTDRKTSDLLTALYHGFNFLGLVLTWSTIPAWGALAFLLSRPGESGANKHGDAPELEE